MRWIPLLLLCLLTAACSDEAAPPHVLLISIDTCRADHCGWLGARLPDGSSPTPHLDRLAAGSVGPKDALSCVPLTLPAHTTLFSGLLPDATGIRENDSFAVPAAATRGYSLLAEELRGAAYETAAFVSGQPLERASGLDAGFRNYSAPDRGIAPEGEMRFRERTAQETTALAQAWLRERRDDEPWMLFVHYFDPHQPWERRPEGQALPEGPHQNYLSEIMAVDRAVGELLAAVPQRERTLIIVLSDHGEGLGEHGEETHGHLVHDATLRVPFLMVLPRGATSARAATPPARLEDVTPTVRALCKLPTQQSDGVSLLDACTEATWRSSAESLYPWFQFRCAPERSFRDVQWKLVESAAETELFAWPEDRGERENRATQQAERVLRLQQEAALHAARGLRGHAVDRDTEPSAHAPYMGTRNPEQSAVPTVAAQRKLPRVAERFDTLQILEQVRAAIRAGHPAEGLMLLAPVAAQAEENPAVLFWTGRCADLAARDTTLEPRSRLAFAEQALQAYDKHQALFADVRSADAALRVLLECYAINGGREALQQVERRATGSLNVRGPRGLTLALRGRAREAAGRLQDALADYAQAADLVPDDERLRADARRLREALKQK